MEWDVEVSDAFATWFEALNEKEQDAVARVVNLLAEFGPDLPFPYSSGIVGARYKMRELRVQCAGQPYRVLYAFDPRRCAMLLIGGNKTGNDRWYEEHVPQAETLYEAHLRQLTKEGLL